MLKILKYIVLAIIVGIGIPILMVALTFIYTIFTESNKDESKTPTGITRQAIETKNIFLCDTIHEPLAGLSGSSDDLIISRCYVEYVKVHPTKKACEGLAHTITYCKLTLAEIMLDASICKQDSYCVGNVANIKNDINECKILTDTTKEKDCEKFFIPKTNP